MKAISVFFILCLTSTAIFAAGDIQKGKGKAVMCAGCHGAAGVSVVPMYPNLAGQKAQYLEKQLNDFQSGTRNNPIMSSMAKSLSKDDIANVAAYYSSL